MATASARFTSTTGEGTIARQHVVQLDDLRQSLSRKLGAARDRRDPGFQHGIGTPATRVPIGRATRTPPRETPGPSAFGPALVASSRLPSSARRAASRAAWKQNKPERLGWRLVTLPSCEQSHKHDEGIVTDDLVDATLAG